HKHANKAEGTVSQGRGEGTALAMLGPLPSPLLRIMGGFLHLMTHAVVHVVKQYAVQTIHGQIVGVAQTFVHPGAVKMCLTTGIETGHPVGVRTRVTNKSTKAPTQAIQLVDSRALVHCPSNTDFQFGSHSLIRV